MSGIYVRTAKDTDLLDIVELYHKGFKHWIVSKYSKPEVGAFKGELYRCYKEMLTNNLTHMYVGVHEGKCIGFIICTVEEFPASSQLFATVCWFHISQEHRSSHLFLKLFRKAEEWAKKSGFTIMNWGFNQSKYSDKLKSIMTKKGYEPYEYQYLKHL